MTISSRKTARLPSNPVVLFRALNFEFLFLFHIYIIIPTIFIGFGFIYLVSFLSFSTFVSFCFQFELWIVSS